MELRIIIVVSIVAAVASSIILGYAVAINTKLSKIIDRVSWLEDHYSTINNQMRNYCDNAISMDKRLTRIEDNLDTMMEDSLVYWIKNCSVKSKVKQKMEEED